MDILVRPGSVTVTTAYYPATDETECCVSISGEKYKFHCTLCEEVVA